jgi:hypothetical protein
MIPMLLKVMLKNLQNLHWKRDKILILAYVVVLQEEKKLVYHASDKIMSV